MATPIRSLLRHNSQISQCPKSIFTRFMSTSGSREHNYLPPDDYVGSWQKPATPREGLRRLYFLRVDYRKKVKVMRKEYIHEMELKKIEKERKAAAKAEALRLANEERKRVKAAKAEARAAENKATMEELRQTIMQEKAQKLEYWRMKEKKQAQKREEEKTLLRRKSSLWISEPELEKKIMEAIIDSSRL